MTCTRRHLLITSAASCLSAASEPASPNSFWVFGLLRPRELRITAFRGTRLHCRLGAAKFVLESEASYLLSHPAQRFNASGPNETPASFVLEVPDTLRRRFYGMVSVENANGIFIPSIRMPVEVAVGAIVGAELPVSSAPLQALMAQAVVARSFMLATRAPRHPNAFFCDTTHCQFMRSPALPGSDVARAVLKTERLVLASAETAFPASYSAACGGRTEGGERDGFVYTPVDCTSCRSLGLERRGHGWGLCQEGAMDLARRGASMRQILDHYFPEASLRYL